MGPRPYAVAKRLGDYLEYHCRSRIKTLIWMHIVPLKRICGHQQPILRYKEICMIEPQCRELPPAARYLCGSISLLALGFGRLHFSGIRFCGCPAIIM
jgi:hypothetical protein